MRLSVGLLMFACALQAQPIHLEFDPGSSKVEYTVSATLHTVHGEFALRRGAVTYNPATGDAQGEIVVDATSGHSGNDSRDHRMHKAILESAQFSEIKFIPDHVAVRKAAGAADSDLDLHGQFWLHGEPHELVMHAKVHPQDGLMKVTSAFQVPYVDWGLKSASMFMLRVSNTVDVHFEADAKVIED